LSQFLLAAGQLDEARSATQRAHEINPNLEEADDDVGPTIDLLQGRPATLLAFSQAIQDDAIRLWAIAIATHALGRAAESKKSLDELIAKFASTEPTAIAEVYGWRGDGDQALQWLTRAYDVRDPNLYALNYRAAYAKLRGDSRYTALLRKMNLL
jgi:tetratricopeptide (TPR) repeat protein